MLVTFIVQQNVRVIGLVGPDEESNVAKIGYVEFYHHYCRPGIFRHSVILQCHCVSDCRVHLCLPVCDFSGLLDRASRRPRLGVLCLVSSCEHSAKCRLDFVFLASLDKVRIEKRGDLWFDEDLGNNNENRGYRDCGCMAVRGPAEGVAVGVAGAGDFGSAYNGRRGV